MPEWANQVAELPTPVVPAASGHLAILSNLTARPRPIWVNVGERPYSADYTNSANTAQAIQAGANAIDAAGGGGVLYTPSGTYKIGRNGVAPDVANPAHVDLGDNITVKGDGPGKTIFKLADTPATSGAFGPFRNKGRPIAGGGTGLRNHHISFEDMTLDGNKGAVTEFVANRQGILLEGVDDVRVVNVEANNFLNDAIVLASGVRGHITDCVVRNNLKAGIYVPASDHMQIKGCVSKNNGSIISGIGMGIVLAASWFCSVVGCSSEDDKLCGISLDRDTQFCTIEGNNVDTISMSGNPIGGGGPIAGHLTRPVAWVNDGRYYYAYNNVVRGNTVRGTRTYPGIGSDGGDYNLIEGNVVSQCNNDGIRVLGGTGNVVRNNTVRDWGLAASAGLQNGIRLADAAAFGSTGALALADTTVEGNILRNTAGTPGCNGIVIGTGGGSGISGCRVLRNSVIASQVVIDYYILNTASEFEASGPGTPEGATFLYVPPGSTWHRTDGGVGTSLYVKQTSGASNLGWAGK